MVCDLGLSIQSTPWNDGNVGTGRERALLQSRNHSHSSVEGGTLTVKIFFAVVTNSDLHVLVVRENEGSRTWSVVVVKRRGMTHQQNQATTLVVTSVRRKATKGVTEAGNHDLK